MQYNVFVLSKCDYLLSERPNLKKVSKRLELYRRRQGVITLWLVVQVEGRVQVSLLTATKKEVILREPSVRVNDGKYHVVRLVRAATEVSLQVDDLQVGHYFPHNESHEKIHVIFFFFRAFFASGIGFFLYPQFFS